MWSAFQSLAKYIAKYNHVSLKATVLMFRTEQWKKSIGKIASFRLRHEGNTNREKNGNVVYLNDTDQLGKRVEVRWEDGLSPPAPTVS